MPRGKNVPSTSAMGAASQTVTPDTELFRNVFNASPIGIVVENLEGQLLFANPTFCSMLGFSEEELRSKHCVEFSPPEDAKKDWALFQQLRAGSIDHYQLEKRYFRRDGSSLWGRLSISLLTNGPFPLVLAMVEDISEKRAGMDREHDLLEMMSSITKQMAAAVTRCSSDFRYLWVNQAYADWIQRPINEVVNRSISDVLGKEAFDSLLPRFKQVLQGETVQYEQETNFRGIGRRWISATYTPTFDVHGATDGWVAVVLDVTDQKWAEETRFKHVAIVESYKDAIISKDSSGIITSWNTGAERIFGYKEEEVIGRPISILIPPELWDEENKILESLRAGERIEHYETKRATKTGKRVDVSLTIGPIKDSSGRVVGFTKIAHDITQQKETAKALKESEMQYRRIVETTNEGVWLLDSNLHTSYVNRQMAEELGYEPSEMVGKSVFEFYFPEDVKDKKQILEGRRQGRREQREERLRRRDGSELWVRMAATPVFKDNGEFDGALAMMSNITERKRSDEELLKSEERFRLAAQAGKMFAYEWDVATDAIVRSEDFARILGNDEQVETTGQQVLGRIHPDDQERVKAAVAALTPENPKLQITYRMLRLDGTIIWVERNSRAYFDDQGKMQRVVGMVKDVTHRIKAEQALRTSEERLRLAQWAAHIGTFDVNLRTGVDIWPPETEALYGLPPGGFGGTLTAFEDLIHSDDRERVIELTQEMMRTGQPTEGEWRVVWPDGSVHWIASRGQVLMNESGEPSRMLGVNMDVTERKRAEETLSGMARKLLEAQEQERARIGRELHDDINQRLAMLALELEQLRESPSDLQNRVQELRKQTTEISEDVQALSHELHSSKLEYLGVVAGMKSCCKEFGQRHKLEINFRNDVPSVVPFEMGVSLFRVLQEALHNAVKHSGVKRIEVEMREDSGEIHLSVSDSGKGFDLDTALQGRGLGLTSMRERVRLVNGTISIESKPMGGTRIHVRVPFESERARRAAG